MRFPRLKNRADDTAISVSTTSVVPDRDSILRAVEAGDLPAVRSMLLATGTDGAELRHDAFLALQARLPADINEPAPIAEPTGAIPELAPANLTGATLAEGIATSGAVLVRGLIPADTAVQLRETAEEVLQHMAAVNAGTAEPDQRYRPLAVESNPLGYRRKIAQLENLGSLLADSPLLLDRYARLLADTGVVRVISEYLGTPAALSADKSVIRRVPADAGTNWHQDGAFLGADVRSMNLWVSLSDCGVDAPGLDLIPQRFRHIHETGTQGADFKWSVGPGVVAGLTSQHPWVTPTFAPGDAVLFDHFCLHRTGILADMTKSRYAMESWFFAPQAFPDTYTGLFV